MPSKRSHEITILTFQRSDHVPSEVAERLFQVEEQCSSLVALSPQARIPRECATGEPRDTASQGRPSLLRLARNICREFIAAGFSGSGIDTNAAAQEPAFRHMFACPSAPLNADARLEKAFEQVVHRKRQNLSRQTAYLDIHVRPEISKACVESKDWLIGLHQLQTILIPNVGCTPCFGLN